MARKGESGELSREWTELSCRCRASSPCFTFAWVCVGGSRDALPEQASCGVGPDVSSAGMLVAYFERNISLKIGSPRRGHQRGTGLNVRTVGGGDGCILGSATGCQVVLCARAGLPQPPRSCWPRRHRSQVVVIGAWGPAQNLGLAARSSPHPTLPSWAGAPPCLSCVT